MSLEYRKLTKQDLDTFIDMRINQLREEGAKELLSRVVNEAREYGCGTVQITASDMAQLAWQQREKGENI
ncbi:MAG: hypothetical protein J6L77_04645 [Coprococcus sp.]|nr:hypothetical protein [Lachnospiraceae bacterium]MBP3325691.1 hypothetical protein [Coprococcus sp.]